MSSVYNPFAREPHYRDLVRDETFHGPRAPALLPALLTPGLVRDALSKMKEEAS
jgi:hypothetical protein